MEQSITPIVDRPIAVRFCVPHSCPVIPPAEDKCDRALAQPDLADPCNIIDRILGPIPHGSYEGEAL